jgi:hypothetical protein
MTDTDVSLPVALWRLRTGSDLIDAMMAATWYVYQDSYTGAGWAVTVVDEPPSKGAPVVTWVASETIARHLADLHNTHLASELRRAETRARVQAILDARPKLEPGDLIVVPPGAGKTVTTGHRVRVQKVSAYYIGGYREKADGTPMQSRSVINGTPEGYVSGMVDWEELPRCTVHRGDQVVYSPKEDS